MCFLPAQNEEKPASGFLGMAKRSTTIAKINHPKIRDVCHRKRLFQRMDAGRDYPVTWVTGPPGSGKTTLVASYLDTCRVPFLWYQVDRGDADIATFFYYMGMAAKKAFPKKRKPLPVLTPEYLSDISSFTHRYFEELYGKLNPPFIIVFDNYQDAPDESDFHDVISAGLSTIPEGIHVIVVSRNEPLPAFSRLRANNGIHFIGWNELRLTLEESREIVRMKDRRSFTNESITDLHEKTDGWAAGLVLMVEIAKTKDIGRHILKELTPQEIFDYFANEVFKKTNKQTQTFLLKTAFLPRMTPHMAEKLTGANNSEQILSDLNKKHYFTTQYGYHVQSAYKQQGTSLQDSLPSGVRKKEEKPHHAILSYQYHPLFREFLLSRARNSFNPENLSQIQRYAAEILEASGMIEDAAVILRDDKDWNGLANLILNQAASMSAQGRNKTLEEWLLSFPRDMLENTPWLLYWLGVCRFLYNNPAESRTYFDKAFEQFRAQGDFTGVWLSWAYAVDTFFHEFDNFSPFDSYIQIFEELIQQRPVFPSPEIEFRIISCRFICMMLRQPDHSEIKLWAERVFALLQKCSDVNLCLQTGFYLSVHYVCMGDFIRAGILINLLRKRAQAETAIPLMRLLVKAAGVLYSLNTGSSGLCIQHVSEALAYAHETGVHIWDIHVLSTGVCAALNDGDMDTATRLLRKIEPGLAMARKIDVGFYHHISAMKEMLMGNLSLAAEHIQINVRILSEINAHFALTLGRITMSHVYAALGKYPEAVAQLALARQIGLWMKSKHIEYMCLLTEAYYALELGIEGVDELSNAETSRHLPFSPPYDKGKESEGDSQLPRSPFVEVDAVHGIEILRRAMALGREQNFIGCFIWRFDIMPRLCVKALEAGIEVAYVRHLIRKRNLIPDDPPIQCENWPWPIKIFTLGRFMILKEDKPIQFAGKVQHKPLEMLKAILSIGGGEAPEDQLVDALWPDAEGDTAHHAFEITLHRLRRLLDSDKAVIRHGGLVSLDKRYCWVDMVSFERMVEDIEDMRREMEKRGTGEAENGGTGEAIRSSLPHSVFPIPPFPHAPPISPTQSEMLRFAEKAMNLYKGSFLSPETRHAWAASVRERLRDKFRHLVISLGTHLEQTRQWENAAAHYRKAVEKDDLAEAFYQRLMVCYQQLGQGAQGVEVYHRLKSALSAAFGIEPSPLTESLYKSLCCDNT
ncbi:MAG: hypothetical protein DPW20_08105 [Candidatus Brocadia sp.]|nr:MAG: hypothetical protein EDM70_09610 [Candidatus Brocadia sp. AMX2]MBC6932237.1 hypothetical protein [Candidatus Brocadia sp.]MBL1168509.1 hypothetical protein [Candidatus Brocadia sp. AMX1]MCQ3917332.1 hypothetical protein [Candidatus Brocadia sp.]RIJ90368.1 MAG: hypothetical protein DB853_11730 [Candidatus Brocadia sp.]